MPLAVRGAAGGTALLARLAGSPLEEQWGKGKVVDKTLGLAVSFVAGTVASAVFEKVWQLSTGENEAPQATDVDRGWPEILLAAALHGAIFAVVKQNRQALHRYHHRCQPGHQT